MMLHGLVRLYKLQRLKEFGYVYTTDMFLTGYVYMIIELRKCSYLSFLSLNAILVSPKLKAG